MVKRKTKETFFKKQKTTLFLFLGALVVFFARYIPFTTGEPNNLFTLKFSLMSASTLCNEIFNVAPDCSVVQALNIASWIVIAILVVLSVHFYKE